MYIHRLICYVTRCLRHRVCDVFFLQALRLRGPPAYGATGAWGAATDRQAVGFVTAAAAIAVAAGRPRHRGGGSRAGGCLRLAAARAVSWQQLAKEVENDAPVRGAARPPCAQWGCRCGEQAPERDKWGQH